MEIKLQITNRFNENFLRSVMNSNKIGNITINRKSEIGKYICSRVRYSNLPTHQSSGVILNLPKNTLESAHNFFLYFTVEDQKKINDFLESEFYLFFHRYMLTGDQFDMKKSKLIENFIERLNLLNDDKIFENLKKSDYRERRKVQLFMLETVHLAII